MTTDTGIEAWLAGRASEVDASLAREMAAIVDAVEPRLHEAMVYSLNPGGKRIRPVLVLAAAEAVGPPLAVHMRYACAVEMIHTYSLVHDDLPAMDDDDIRRGKASNHKVFGEAIAILAGDGLLTEAFSLISRAEPATTGDAALRAVSELAEAAGPAGMVGGQAGDLLAEGRPTDADTVESVHRRKTGALLRASLRIGGIVGGASDQALLGLTTYGESFGLAFQIADDLLDHVGNTAATGKAGRRDEERGKATFPAVWGEAASHERLRSLREEGSAALEPFGPAADPLRALLGFVVARAL